MSEYEIQLPGYETEFQPTEDSECFEDSDLADLTEDDWLNAQRYLWGDYKEIGNNFINDLLGGKHAVRRDRWRQRKSDVMDLSEGKCYLCGDYCGIDEGHVDHVTPKKEGDKRPPNMSDVEWLAEFNAGRFRWTCAECNLVKQRNTPAAARAMIRVRKIAKTKMAGFEGTGHNAKLARQIASEVRDDFYRQTGYDIGDKNGRRKPPMRHQ